MPSPQKTRWLEEAVHGYVLEKTSRGMSIRESPHKSPYPDREHPTSPLAHLQSDWTKSIHYESKDERAAPPMVHTHPDEAAQNVMEGKFINADRKRAPGPSRPVVSCKPCGSYKPASEHGASSAASLFAKARDAHPTLTRREILQRETGRAHKNPNAPKTPVSMSPGGLHEIIHSPTSKPASIYTPRNHRVTHEVSMEIPVRHGKSKAAAASDDAAEKVLKSKVREKFYGSPCKRTAAKSSELSVSESGAVLKGEDSNKFGPARVRPVGDQAPLHQAPASVLNQTVERLLLELRQSDDLPKIHQLFVQYCRVGEVRTPPGLAHKKLLLLCHNSGLIDTRVSSGVCSVLAREVCSATIHDNVDSWGKAAAHRLPGTVGAGAGMGTMLLSFDDFLNFVIRAAVKKYRDCNPQECVRNMVDELLLPLVENSAVAPQEAHPDTVETLTKDHQETLVALFCHYCAKEDMENQAVLGADYRPPDYKFRLELQGLNMFAADSGLLKLISPQAVLVQYDAVLEKTGESSLRYTGWIEWLATIANLAFKPQDGGHAILKGYNFPEISSGSGVATAIMQVVESSHETALVMHSRGIATGQEATYFKDWEENKDALIHGDTVTNSPAVQGARLAQALTEDGLLEELQHLYGFYCQSATDLRCDVINRQGFCKLLNEARVFGVGGLKKEDAHIIYEKNVMGKFRASKSEADSARKASKSLVYAVENKGNRSAKPMMTFDIFLASVCELAAAAELGKGHKASVEQAVAFVKDYILTNCEGRLMFQQNDAFSQLMDSPVVKQVVQTYKQPLQALFIGFAQPFDRDSVMHWSAAERETCSIEMNFSQLWEFAIEAQLLPVISRKQLANVLLVATGGEASTCTYSQFEEILIRCSQLFSGRSLSTPEQLSDAIVELFAHMDGSPAVKTVTANIGNTHSGTLRLVIEPSRRPFAKQQRGEVEALEQSLSRVSAPGTRALNDEASGDPEHSLVPEYCEEMFKSADAHKRGSPPWRGTGEEPWEVDLEEVEDTAAPPIVNQVEDGLEGTAYDEGQESALKQSSGYDTAAPSMEDLETLRPYE